MKPRAAGPLDALHAIRAADLTDDAPRGCKPVAYVVASYMGYGEHAGIAGWASVETIGRGAGISARTVQRCLAWMLTHGLLDGTRSHGRDTHHLLLNVDAWRRLAPPVAGKPEAAPAQPRHGVTLVRHPDTLTLTGCHPEGVTVSPHPPIDPPNEPPNQPPSALSGGVGVVVAGWNGPTEKRTPYPPGMEWLEAYQ